MLNVDDFIKRNDALWQETMNKLLICTKENEPLYITILDNLNAERRILQKAKEYELTNGL